MVPANINQCKSCRQEESLEMSLFKILQAGSNLFLVDLGACMVRGIQIPEVRGVIINWTARTFSSCEDVF